MSEEVINYNKNSNSTWLQNKYRGLTNRYHKKKRHFLWKIHTLTHTIEVDETKVPGDSIPVLINNFNRVQLLKEQIDWFLSLDDKVCIIIVDNDSTYPPLLDFYRKIDHPLIQVVMLGFNSWRKGVEYIGRKKLKKFDKYIITDSDLLPYPTTPKDIVGHISKLLDKYPEYNHIGASLEIGDIPNKNPLKDQIINFESKYWSPKAKLLNNEVFVAKIDSTFAMYRSTSKVLITEPALRTNRPYTIKHMDWYLSPQEFSEEYIYYLKSCKSFATWATQLKNTKLKEKNTIS